MLVRNNSSTSLKSVSGLPDECVNQDALWSEYKYRGGSEIFGEAEPADYIYQVREGAVRTYKLLSDGRRQIGAFHLSDDVFGVESGEVHRFTAEAILHTSVWLAKRRSLFAGLATDDIPTANTVRGLISQTLEHAEDHLLLLGRQTALEKVAAFLVEMDRRLDQPEVMARLSRAHD
jgi:CRP/FNR family nitrogen fixation transcriptional regulator